MSQFTVNLKNLSSARLVFFACFILLFIACGSLVFDYTPFHDDLLTLLSPWQQNGLNYLGGTWLFFRPLEYLVFGISWEMGLPGLPVFMNIGIIAATAVFALKTIVSMDILKSQHPLVLFLIGSFFVLTPIIAASGFNVDTFSQCLANFCSVYLLWDLILKKDTPLISLFVFALGMLAKESFYLVGLAYGLIKITRNPTLLLSYSYLAVLAFGLAARNAIVESKLDLSQGGGYRFSFGLNFVKNLALHFVGLFYPGSSPDLFILDFGRELVPILLSLILLACFLQGLLRVNLFKKTWIIWLFAVLSLIPGVIMQTVSEHNTSAFVWFGSILVVCYLLNSFDFRHVAIILLLFAFTSGISDARKASLLEETMNDFKKMKAEYADKGYVSCRRSFDRTFSYYYFNSSKHLPYLEESAHSSRILCSD